MRLRRGSRDQAPVNVAEIEQEIERDRRAADEDLSKRINAAVCADVGHVPAQEGVLAESVEITTWGSATPVRQIGPYCSRCSADLSDNA